MPDPASARILIHGATGRMGTALLRLLPEIPGATLAAAVSRHGGTTAAGIACTAASDLAAVPTFDVAIDFSLPDAFDPILALCRTRGSAFVSGTTGLGNRQLQALDVATTEIPLLWAANFSIGVAVLAELVRRAAAALPAWDCDIVETHHTRKRDAPSGTALHLGAQVEAGRGQPPHYASLRAGDVIGEHTVQFTTAGERIELVHRAGNRDIFARGALRAAVALAVRPAGRYGLIDLLDVAS